MKALAACGRALHRAPIWLIFIIVLVAALPISYWLGNRDSTPPDAFTLPRQTVVSRVPGVAGAAVKLGDPIIVTGTKCNATGQTLIGHGSVSWISVQPGGVIEQLPAAGASAWGPHECRTSTFVNPMPDAVVQAIEALAKYEHGPILWAVTGSITADHYAVQTWVTEPFRVVVP